MACTLLELVQTDCSGSDGGIFKSFLIDAAKVDASGITHVNQLVSSITTSENWVEFRFDTDNDTAYYNQEGERTNNKHVYNQTAFMQFSGIDETKRAAAEALKQCCAVVAVHFLNNGKVLIQGVELLTSPDWKITKKAAKATINILTDTGNNEDRIEVTLISQSRQASPFTTMDESDFTPST